MDALGLAVLTFLVIGGSMAVTGAVLLRTLPSVSRDRLKARARDSSSTSIVRWGASEAGWQRMMARLGRVSMRTEARQSKYRQRLTWAGYHNPHAVMIFGGVKVATALMFGAAYPLSGILYQRVLPNVFLLSIAFAVLGFLVPDVWIRRRASARQERITNALPEVLDLLTVCVEGGMSFDAAMARVAEQPEVRESPLHEEIQRMILEMRAGRPRQEALRALADRCGVQDVNAMVSVFIQTDRLGTSMGKTLRVHADSSRTERRHRAEERAYLAPLKMIVPTALFLMPAFMLVAMGPSLLAIMNALNRAGGK